MVQLTVVEYQGANGWYVTASQQQAGWNWRYIPNMLKLNLKQYIELLIQYKATILHYYVPTDCLLYYFNTKDDAHKWVLFINRMAKKYNYLW